MPLSWNEIRNRAHEFSKRWEHESSEDAEAKSFWSEFFGVFGIDRKRVATFEEPVKKLGDRQGFIDLFWKGMLLVEHKSRGKDLDKAYTQALDYFPGIKERDLPKYVLVSDFARFRLYDLEAEPSPSGRGQGEGVFQEFKLADLHKHIKHFAFIAGYRTQTIAPQNPVNIKAAERMGKLHDALKSSGYEGHALEVLLVRLLFCLFAEDTGIFQPASAFRAWIEERTAADGSDLGPQLTRLFQVLNTPEDKRSNNLDEQTAAFPYVNGKLFAEMLPIADFNVTMREALLDCCALDWSAISPAIFGALFQSIMDAKARRNIGAHYTSEENILKLIQPLFMDELHAEFQRVKSNKNKLFEFHKKLRTLTFFDPACGCGNFLVIAYRELRKLELDVLRCVHDSTGSRFLDVHQEISVDVDQFFGIEIEEFPAQIAQVALWLMDHQMNVRVSEEFGMYFARIPLKTSPHIVNGNALTLDWNDVLPAERASFVLGNPPFVGAKFMDDAQRADVQNVFAQIKNGGLLDFVAAWYVKAARYMNQLPSPACGGRAGDEGLFTARTPQKLPEDIKIYAREMRKNQTDAEQLIWHLLRGREISLAKFRRQHPIGRYILDFYCVEHQLAVELDGGQHSEQANYDETRTAFLNAQGIRVLRFWNNEVLQETEAVMEVIWQALQLSPASTQHPSPQPSPASGRGSKTAAAFVSTNSITQGEQVGILWGELLNKYHLHIHFAHRTFSWSNEARGVAAVHCVIIGFGAFDVAQKTIYEYEDIRGAAHAVAARNINPYLVDAPDVVLVNRQHPICDVPEIGIGNKPIDGGHYLFTPQEKAEFVAREPQAEKWMRRWIGADEFINGYERWCLWLGDCPPDALRKMPEAMKRIEAVRQTRLASKSAPTQKLAATPTRFHVENIPDAPYLVIPEVSSERRRFIPIGFMQPDTLSSNKVRILPNATLYHFGILTSTMHMAWMRYTTGRLKSDYQYSITIVYNNFPWPDLPSPTGRGIEGEGTTVEYGTDSPSSPALPPAGEGSKRRAAIEAAAQAVLDARAQFMLPSPASGRGVGGEGERESIANSASLADLYDPLTMPSALVKAHQQLDRAVDASYRKAAFANDAQRVEFLFERYQQLTSLLPVATAKPKRSKKVAA
ncbi:MAG: DUF559 domain-containing protein [Gallionella sp.]|nr:DUF559 domain-containing protein [Gallionella sp.]